MPPTHLHFDPFSGVSGDMMLGALLDLRVDGKPLLAVSALEEGLQKLGLSDRWTLRVGRVQRCGVGGTDVGVVTPEGHHHRHRADLLELAERLDLSARGHARAVAAIDALAAAEARVHGTSIDAVHFHEVGAIDSIVDLLGNVLALELLGVDTLSCGPLPVGRGYVDCAHGRMPVPAPATAYLCEGLPTVGVDREGELVTPTGAALVSTLCDAFGPPPAMTAAATGYGAGDRDDPRVPNLLRVVLGSVGAAGAGHRHRPGQAGARSHGRGHAEAGSHGHPHTHGHAPPAEAAPGAGG
ncbi:LarC family nickel insertion protein [Phycisphaera mikurensis]|uniref:LarC family nickel insertion protein n=1 Tax=Phycisphaera mikurensis (strain NBRC 102666 / KCTC 22515 / FYK2301M01) TaxID=1142394 RepID=I0IFK5_PHYMF|nr:LarC family nickel insertion protein [Phycisphaera mikurensis]MBB6440565.1 hypothetical protein [Phycisphaera mikurensis]BAM04043.1 hypothetical protein PSMK_18840 [Phycisphaera mikurensis NBRC 102666]